MMNNPNLHAQLFLEMIRPRRAVLIYGGGAVQVSAMGTALPGRACDLLNNQQHAAC